MQSATSTYPRDSCPGIPFLSISRVLDFRWATRSRTGQDIPVRRSSGPIPSIPTYQGGRRASDIRLGARLMACQCCRLTHSEAGRRVPLRGEGMVRLSGSWSSRRVHEPLILCKFSLRAAADRQGLRVARQLRASCTPRARCPGIAVGVAVGRTGRSRGDSSRGFGLLRGDSILTDGFRPPERRLGACGTARSPHRPPANVVGSGRPGTETPARRPWRPGRP